MEVSIIIVNFFSAAYLRRCLEAVATQTVKPHSVLIVNNGDVPGALDFIADTYPGHRVLERTNIGYAAGNNLAVELAGDVEWVALLNPDAFPEPDWLETLLRCAALHSEVDIFSSQMLQDDNPQLLDGAGDCYHLSGLAWRGLHGKRDVRPGTYKEVFSACGAAAMFRRSALLKVGGFDESFFCYFEDVDLGFRLRLQGFRCLHVYGAVVRHVGSVSSGGAQSDFALYHGHRNLVWTFVKNMPGYLFWLLLPVHICLNLAEILWFSLRGRANVICRAKRDAIKGLPAAWSQRGYVQKQRVASYAAVLSSMSLWPLPDGK